jgi:hypothetical protein
VPLIYLLLRVRAKVQKGLEEGDLFEIGIYLALAGVFIA